LVCTL